MPTTSANMGLVVPIASTGASGTGDVGPGYAQNISADLLTNIDQHDHSFGKGVQITPAGLNISSDLTVQSNNLTNVRGTRFTSQASALAGVGDTSELYVKLGDLWYVNASGVQVQVTANSGLATGPEGATGPAGTSFVSNYFQAGVTGFTGLGSWGPVTWNAPLLQAGTVSQATSMGTGAAWISVAQAGLYEVSYRLAYTGVLEPSLSLAVYQMINATGTNAAGSPVGGTQVAASQTFYAGPMPTGGTLVASSRYLVQLAAGNNIQTYAALNSVQTKALTPTGTLFTITKLG